VLTSSAMRQCRDSPRHNTAGHIYMCRAQALVSTQQQVRGPTSLRCVLVYLLVYSMNQQTCPLRQLSQYSCCASKRNNDLQTLRKASTQTTQTLSNRAFLWAAKQLTVAIRSRRMSAAVCLLGSRVRIRMAVWMFVPLFVCRKGGGVCDGLIARSRVCYQVCVSNCLWSRYVNEAA
jgi:hypothetical protein